MLLPLDRSVPRSNIAHLWHEQLGEEQSSRSGMGASLRRRQAWGCRAYEGGRTRVRAEGNPVNAVCPGFIHTYGRAGVG
jgi:hypothetical protein